MDFQTDFHREHFKQFLIMTKRPQNSHFVQTENSFNHSKPFHALELNLAYFHHIVSKIKSPDFDHKFFKFTIEMKYKIKIIV